MRHVYLLALVCDLLLGCRSASSAARLTVPRPMREDLRTEAIGCWRITDAPSKQGRAGTWWLPLQLQLDTGVTEQDLARGYRRVWRLDSLGRRQLKDVEGFEILDKWGADSMSNRLVIAIGNGLYGTTMVLTLDTASSPDLMRGEGQEYGDVIPAPVVPIVPVIATRIACRADNSGR